MSASSLRRAARLSTTALLLLGAVLSAPAEAKKDPDGFVQVTLSQGLLGCAVGAELIATANVCPHGVTGDRSYFSFETPDGADVTIVELRWTQTTVVGARNLALMTAWGDDAHTVEGPSILKAEIAAEDNAASTLRVLVGASHDVNVVLQQPFDLAVSVFVGTEPPAGYSAFA